jgi:NAD(P)-dependent dehydrogenase (short-subunit alcohol dehydrogenase family)
MKLTACVTGAERGLGYELTKALLETGYIVFAGRFNRNWTLLEELQSKYPSELFILDLDVSSDASVQAVCKTINALTYKVDVLINNAAITGDNQSTIADSLNYDEMLQVINVNAVGALRMMNGLYPLLLQGSQKLIMNISSEAGSISTCHRKGWFAYCSSKAAMNMYSAIVHNNLKEQGGQVLVTHPGWMKSWLSGAYQEVAPLTPDIPAKKLVEMIQNPPAIPMGAPNYVDYEGVPWTY